MPKNDAATIDAYIAAQPAAARSALEKMRRVIGKAIPDADEAISYGMPAYRLRGRVVVYFAGWKQHTALYPGQRADLRRLRAGGRRLRDQQRHAAVSPRRAPAGQADRRHRQVSRRGGGRDQQSALRGEEKVARCQEKSPGGEGQNEALSRRSSSRPSGFLQTASDRRRPGGANHLDFGQKPVHPGRANPGGNLMLRNVALASLFALLTFAAPAPSAEAASAREIDSRVHETLERFFNKIGGARDLANKSTGLLCSPRW